jgi:hypothetical protein
MKIRDRSVGKFPVCYKDTEIRAFPARKFFVIWEKLAELFLSKKVVPESEPVDAAPFILSAFSAILKISIFLMVFIGGVYEGR